MEEPSAAWPVVGVRGDVQAHARGQHERVMDRVPPPGGQHGLRAREPLGPISLVIVPRLVGFISAILPPWERTLRGLFGAPAPGDRVRLGPRRPPQRGRGHGVAAPAAALPHAGAGRSNFRPRALSPNSVWVIDDATGEVWARRRETTTQRHEPASARSNATAKTRKTCPPANPRDALCARAPRILQASPSPRRRHAFPSSVLNQILKKAI